MANIVLELSDKLILEITPMRMLTTECSLDENQGFSRKNILLNKIPGLGRNESLTRKSFV